MLIDILDLNDVIVLYHAFVVNGWIMPLLKYFLQEHGKR